MSLFFFRKEADETKSKTYEEFVEKFKPKKTTDDCMTPPLVYDAVKDWAWRAAAERANARRWELSDRELQIVAGLGKAGAP